MGESIEEVKVKVVMERELGCSQGNLFENRNGPSLHKRSIWSFPVLVGPLTRFHVQSLPYCSLCWMEMTTSSNIMKPTCDYVLCLSTALTS